MNMDMKLYGGMDDELKSQYIAATIMEQLGGPRRLKMMIGAKNFIAMSASANVRGGLQFSLPAFGTPRVNKIVVKLNAMDLYDVEFYFLRGGKAKLVAEAKDVFCDNLKSVVEKNTGLYLSMGKVSA